MTPALKALAEAAGVQERWTDAAGRTVQVAEDDLRAVLQAIGLPAGDEAALTASLEKALTTARRAPALLTAWCGDALPLPPGVSPGRALIRLDGGGVFETEIRESGGRLLARTPAAAGYHLLETGDVQIELALAPRGGGGPPPRGFGLAVQIYALREREGAAAEATGDFGDLARFAAAAGAQGADAVAVSPAHALFLAAPEAFQPYAPSSRLFLNGLFADADALPPGSAGDDGGALISWATAGPERARRLRAAFERTAAGPEAAALKAFRRERGAPLEAHVLFEALDGHFRAQGLPGRSRWPAPFQDPASAEVAAFAVRAERERAFHAFVQMAAERSRARAQAAALEAGASAWSPTLRSVSIRREATPGPGPRRSSRAPRWAPPRICSSLTARTGGSSASIPGRCGRGGSSSFARRSGPPFRGRARCASITPWGCGASGLSPRARRRRRAPTSPIRRRTSCA